MDEEKRVLTLLSEVTALLEQLSANLPESKRLPKEDLIQRKKLQTYQADIHQIQQELDAAFQKTENNSTTFKILFDAAPVAYLLLDSNLQITAANEAALHLLKADNNMLLGSEFISLLSTEYRQAGISFFSEIAPNLQDACAVHITNPDGSGFFAQLICKHLQVSHQKQPSYIILLYDVAAWQSFEKKLTEQNHFLQQNNAELEKFIYSVSHDLRSPLVSIMGVINIARMETPDPQITIYLNFIEHSVRKLDNFVQDLINISKNSATDIRIEPIKLRELISGIFDQLQYIENVKLIRKLIEVDAPVELYSDKERLSIVMSNLLSNAIKYHNMEQKDPFIHISIFVNEQQAVISLQDNGLGIGKQHLDRIFNKFYRASQASKGSGLGLFIVKETLEKLQGSIRVISDEGKGSIFTIIVPNRLPST